MEKIIFLDIDGVLNSEEIADEWYQRTGKGWGGFFHEDEKAKEENLMWGPDLVRNLKDIVDSTGAKIVISSMWRKYFSVDKFKEMFKVYGWDAPVIDKTGEQRTSRGIQIDRWLGDHDVDRYVILDDNPDFMPHQQPFYVRTDIRVGLTVEDVQKAVDILNSKHGI